VNLESIFHLLTLVWLVGEILIAVLTFTTKGEGKVKDRGTQIILWIVITGSLTIASWLHDSFPANMPGSTSWLRPLALLILILGLGIRAVAVVSLGKAFSANVALRSGQKLRRSGLYRFVRHPSYFGLELIFLAFGLNLRNWVCFAVVLVPPTLALLYRIHVEEAALRLAFGVNYEEYSRCTKRLIPWIY
jgi:protein-S-isoprenylcysteine O-methyltransferase Ste14